MNFSEQLLGLLCICVLSVLAKAKERVDHVDDFVRFTQKYNKNYKPDEFQHRLGVYKESLTKIEALQKNERGTAVYSVNEFADLTDEEFKKHRLGLRVPPHYKASTPKRAGTPKDDLPTEFDWRTKGVVTPVKDQGDCGSCWAFSVTGNIEGQNAIKTGKLVSLSEQELVDCDKTDSGCNGGLMYEAYQSIKKLGGLESEEDYPYDGRDERCHFDRSKVKVQVQSGLNISSDETEMAQWLVKNGPISIGINADAMRYYNRGVSHPQSDSCDPDELNHGVLIVGYGVDKERSTGEEMPYWVVKNSWGTGWGEKGYYRVYRGDGTCGINTMASSAVL